MANVMRARRRRTPLNRHRVLKAALSLADLRGLDELSMRTVGQKLGVAAMSLYKHVRSKEDMLNGMVDLVFDEIEAPTDQLDWRAAMRRRALSARRALLRHPWAIPLMESRTEPGAPNLKHHDAVLKTLRGAGFSIELAGHAYALLDAYVYGFTLTETALPFGEGSDVTALGADMLRPFGTDTYPALTEFISKQAAQPGYSYGNEFEFGLDLILDGIERKKNDG